MSFDPPAAIAERLLKNPKFRDAFEESRRIHMRTFGDIMEPAFENDPAAEIELVGAVNYISRGSFDKALRKLTRLKKRCRNRADEGARQFFLGLCCERAGMGGVAVQHFAAAVTSDTGFYMTHTLLARLLHRQRSFDAALANYLIAIQLIQEREPRNEIPAVNFAELTGALYAGAADCSLMMGNYDDAEWALCEAEQYGLESKQLYIIYSMLYAATERKALALKKLSELKSLDPELEARVTFDIAEVLSGKSTRFCLRNDILKALDYEAFWSWFEEREGKLMLYLRFNAAFAAASELCMKLTELFAFAKTAVDVQISADKGGYTVSVSDNYMLSLSAGIDALIKKMPDGLSEHWSFEVIH